MWSVIIWLLINGFLNTVKPRIISGPEFIEVTEPETVTITYKYEGLPQPTVTWYFGEKTLPLPSDRYRVETTMDTATLVIPQSVVEDTASYTIQLENPLGTDKRITNVKVKRKHYYYLNVEKITLMKKVYWLRVKVFTYFCMILQSHIWLLDH